MTSSSRKDRILNARIPEELDRDLREQAARLDIPVSQLVRGILQRTVDLVGNLSGNFETLVADMVEDAESIKEAARSAVVAPASGRQQAALIDTVIGWQPVRVNRPSTCLLSGVSLQPGDSAHLGLRDDGRPPLLVSDAALSELLERRRPRVQWIALRLNRDLPCAHTGRPMRVGETAYYNPDSDTPEIICEQAYSQLRASAGVVPVGQRAASGGHEAAAVEEDER